jgi:hypothetical protein
MMPHTSLSIPRGPLPPLALAIALAACVDAAAPGDDPPTGGELPIVAAGVVAERYTGEIAARGGVAYSTTWSNRNGVPGNALKIWDVAGAAVVLVDSVIVEGATTLGDVQIAEDGALLVVATEHWPTGSVMIFDRQQPTRPELLARHQTAATQAGVHTVKLGQVDGRSYAFLSVNSGPNSAAEPAQLVILDITEPAAPVEVLVRPMGDPFIHDVFVRDGWLFTALWHDGIRIWDIGAMNGSPADPIEVGHVRTVGGFAHSVWWFHDERTGSRRYAFVGEENVTSFVFGEQSAGDVHVVDVSDMANPREVAFYSVPGAGAHNFAMDERSGVLYTSFYNGGVRALDVRGDLGECAADARAADGRCDLGRMGRELATALVSPGVGGMRHFIWGVAFDDGFVYASDMLNGIFKLDARSLAR